MNAVMERYGLKGKPSTGLTMATWGFFVGFAAVSLFGPVAKNFNDVMHMKGFLLGLMVAAPNLTGSLLRIPFGAWVDKAGGKKPMLILLAMSIVGMLGLTIVLYRYYPNHLSMQMYPIVLLFGLLSGCGIATFSVGIPQTSYWYPQKRQGFALGTYGGLGNVAPGLFGIILPFALGVLGLAASYLSWFIFLVLGTIIYAVLAKDAYYFQLRKKDVEEQEAKAAAKELGQELYPSGNVAEALKISARVPATWALVALYFTSFGGFLALTGWFPTYWTMLHGAGGRAAGLLMALGFSLLASFVRVYGGTLSDRMGGEKVAIGGFTLVLVGSLGLISLHSFAADLISEIIVGAGMGVSNAAVFKMVPKYVTHAAGGASGWVGGLGAFGGFVVPPILGLFVQAQGAKGYSTGFIVYVILAVISISISVGLMMRGQHRDLAAAKTVKKSVKL